MGQCWGGGGDASGSHGRGRGRGRGLAQAAAPAATPRGSGDELSLPHSKRAREQASKQAREHASKKGSQHGLGESEWGGVVLEEKWQGLGLYSHESTKWVFGLACVCT